MFFLGGQKTQNERVRRRSGTLSTIADETHFHFHQGRRVEEEVGRIWDAGCAR